jgi:ATP-dependent DNA ligase
MISTSRPFSLEPMLCQGVERLPEGREWRYELKLDGVPRNRAQGRTHRSALVSKSEKLRAAFPDRREGACWAA